MIGTWDASRNGSVLSKRWGKQFDETLERDAAEGHLF
jgi:hypothetical protein